MFGLQKWLSSVFNHKTALKNRNTWDFGGFYSYFLCIMTPHISDFNYYYV